MYLGRPVFYHTIGGVGHARQEHEADRRKVYREVKLPRSRGNMYPSQGPFRENQALGGFSEHPAVCCSKQDSMSLKFHVRGAANASDVLAGKP